MHLVKQQIDVNNLCKYFCIIVHIYIYILITAEIKVKIMIIYIISYILSNYLYTVYSFCYHTFNFKSLWSLHK